MSLSDLACLGTGNRIMRTVVEGRQVVTLREGEVSQLGQHGHVGDAEGRSAGLPLNLTAVPKKTRKKVHKGKVSISHRSCTRIQIHRHWRFYHQFPGGLDHERYQMRRFRISEAWVRSGSASHMSFAHFDLQEMSGQNDHAYVSPLFSIMTSRLTASHSSSST